MTEITERRDYQDILLLQLESAMSLAHSLAAAEIEDRLEEAIKCLRETVTREAAVLVAGLH